MTKDEIILSLLISKESTENYYKQFLSLNDIWTGFFHITLAKIRTSIQDVSTILPPAIPSLGAITLLATNKFTVQQNANYYFAKQEILLPSDEDWKKLKAGVSIRSLYQKNGNLKHVSYGWYKSLFLTIAKSKNELEMANFVKQLNSNTAIPNTTELQAFVVINTPGFNNYVSYRNFLHTRNVLFDFSDYQLLETKKSASPSKECYEQSNHTCEVCAHCLFQQIPLA